MLTENKERNTIMTNKKILSALLAAILLATVSCGGTSSGENETTSGAMNSDTTTE